MYTQQFRAYVEATDNGESALIHFRYNKYDLIKQTAKDVFYMASLAKVISDANGFKSNVREYIHSYTFYQQLCSLDQSLPKYGNVYLLINKDSKTFEIGHAFDFTRQSDITEERIASMIPVENDEQVKEELFDHMAASYVITGSGRFKYTSKKDVIKDFNSAVSHKRAILKTESSGRLFKERLTGHYSGLWCSYEACRILVDHFVQKKREHGTLNTFFRHIKGKLNEDIYKLTTRNEQLKTDCLYWNIHKYTIIQNENDLYVNGSRLWNSIVKNESKKPGYRNVHEFIDKKIKGKRLHEFQMRYPGKVVYYQHKNKTRRHLSGYYIHYVFVHFILDYLDATYAFNVAEIMYKSILGTRLIGTP